MKQIDMLKVGLTGIVASWEVVNRDGSIADACYKSDKNLILDVGLDMVGNYASIPACFAYLAIGTGTSEPTISQTTLDAETTYSGTTRPAASGYSAYNDLIIPAADADPFVVVYQIGIQTAVGKINGTFYELGFGPSSTKDSNLWSRFRIKDAEGNPTSVTVNADQQLRLKYQLNIRFLPIVPTHYECAITGYDDTFGYTAGWQGLTSNILASGYKTTYGILTLFGTVSAQLFSLYYHFADRYPLRTINSDVITFAPLTQANTPYTQVGSGPAAAATRDAYVTSSHANYINVQWTTLESVGNIYGLQLSIEYTPTSALFNRAWVVEFDAPIAKPDTHILAFKFKFSWGRDT